MIMFAVYFNRSIFPFLPRFLPNEKGYLEIVWLWFSLCLRLGSWTRWDLQDPKVGRAWKRTIDALNAQRNDRLLYLSQRGLSHEAVSFCFLIEFSFWHWLPIYEPQEKDCYLAWLCFVFLYEHYTKTSIDWALDEMIKAMAEAPNPEGPGLECVLLATKGLQGLALSPEGYLCLVKADRWLTVGQTIKIYERPAAYTPTIWMYGGQMAAIPIFRKDQFCILEEEKR